MLKLFLLRKKQDGFTLIELLVTVVIIGILAAIALPSYLNQAAKAKQSEAKNYVGAVNRAQQAYRIENATFANTFDGLEIGLNPNTVDYRYNLDTPEIRILAIVNAIPNDPQTLRAYRGAVKVIENGLSATVACQTLTPSLTPPDIQTEPVPRCDDNAEVMR